MHDRPPLLVKLEIIYIGRFAVKNQFCFSVLILVIALAAGCAPMPKSGQLTVHQGPAPEITPDKNSAVVTFYRPSSILGVGISYFVQENGENIGALKSGTYFSVRTSPGSHTYTASTEATETVTIQAAANDTTYVEGTLGWGAFAGRPRLKEVPAGTAKSVIPKLKYVELKPSDQSDQKPAY